MWIWYFASDRPDSPDESPAEEQSSSSPRPSPRPQGPTARPDAKSAMAPPSTPDAVEEVAEDEEEYASVGSEINATLAMLLPWAISILFHLGLILLALFVVWTAAVEQEEEEVIIPIARLSETPGGSLTESEDVELQKTQNVRRVRTADTADQDALSDLNQKLNNQVSLIGVAGGGGGKIAPFGTTTGGGVKARFYGTGGNARRLAYVVDASGSLIDTLPFVIRELKRSVSELSPKQQFTVIFFQRDQAIEVPPRGLKKANPETKKAVADWISLQSGNIIPRGKSNPIQALKLAMGYRPDLVFVLSDNITGSGRYEVDKEHLLEMLQTLNKQGRTKINTIQFLYEDELGTLKEISEQHGGIHKFVSRADLGL
jgi:hypothetical protein